MPWVELEDGIVIHEIKQAFRAQGKSQNDFSGLKFLRAPVITPASIKGITPSETSSLCTARSCGPLEMAAQHPEFRQCPSAIPLHPQLTGDVAGDGPVHVSDLRELDSTERP